MTTTYAEELAKSRRFLTLDDVSFLKSLARKLPPRALVADLGAGSGTTALAVLEERPDVFVITYDIDAQALAWAKLAVENAGFARRHACVVRDTTQGPDEGLEPMWRPPFDALLIDTSHEYAATVVELDLWLPVLRSGGTLWLHDCDGGEYPGVKRAFEERLVADRKLKLIAYAGLGAAAARR